MKKPCPICQRPISTVGRRFGLHLEKHERDEISKRMKLYAEAVRLFEVVYGEFDDDDADLFAGLSTETQDGWLRLAKETLCRKK